MAAKNYRPISLVECTSNLGIACSSASTNKQGLIPTSRFGTKAFSYTLDAGPRLVHDIQKSLQENAECEALMFDIESLR